MQIFRYEYASNRMPEIERLNSIYFCFSTDQIQLIFCFQAKIGDRVQQQPATVKIDSFKQYMEIRTQTNAFSI